MDKLKNISQVLSKMNKKDKIGSICQRLLELNFSFTNDIVLINRTKIIENIICFKEILPGDSLKVKTRRLLENWINHKNYIFRISAY